MSTEKDFKGTIIKESLEDPGILDSLEVVASRADADQDDAAGTWHLYTVRVDRDDIAAIQRQLKSEGGWYAHFWQGNDMIVAFRDKQFAIKWDDTSTWQAAIDYGLSVGVPSEQLGFLVE